MAGKKSKEPKPVQLEIESAVESVDRKREVPHPRLITALAITYAVWLGFLVWLACSVS